MRQHLAPVYRVLEACDGEAGLEMTRRLLENMVVRFGYNPVLVESGDAAVALLNGESGQRIDAVVLTHAHWDHVSGVDDLRGVPLTVKAELRHSEAEHPPAGDYRGSDLREVFRRRAKLITTVRRYLDQRGYVEVETPAMQAIPGGAAAASSFTPSC